MDSAAAEDVDSAAQVPVAAVFKGGAAVAGGPGAGNGGPGGLAQPMAVLVVALPAAGFGRGAAGPAQPPVVLSRNGKEYNVTGTNVRAGTEIKVTTERPTVSLSLTELDAAKLRG